MIRQVLVLLGFAFSLLASPIADGLTGNARSNLQRSSHEVVSDTASLIRLRGTGQTSSKYLQYGQADLGSPDFGQVFITNVSFGSHTFEAVIDTGSSDTWLVESGFTCVNQTNNDTLTEPDCYFGTSGFTPDSTFTQIPNENFNISYADGEYLNGIVGYDSVSVAGIKVPKQEVGLASLAAWDGDGFSSGLIGLAFPTLTSAYTGTNASNDVMDGPSNPNATSNRVIYSSIINTIFFVDNLTAPLFSLALSRDGSNTSFGGLLAIGGIPDPTLPTVNASSAISARTPIQILTMQFIDPNTPEYQFYTINVDGVFYSSPSLEAYGADLAPTQFIVDSGTTLNYLPTPAAAAVNALFDPPAQSEEGFYYVACNATAPELGVAIGGAGAVFYHNAADLIMDVGLGDGVCVSGVQDGGSASAGQFILGDVFLKNVLAAFDVGEVMMEFWSRMYYES